MSTKLKQSLGLLIAAFAFKTATSQTIELPGGYLAGSNGFNLPVTNGGLGPITAFTNADSIKLLRDQSGNGNFNNTASGDLTKVFLRFNNQQYTGLKYVNGPTGLLFGGTATTVLDPGFPTETSGGAFQGQKIEGRELFNEIGTYTSPGSGLGVNPGGAPGGPAPANFSARPGTPGAGIKAVWDGAPPANDGNGAFSVFTVAQVQFDGGDSITSANPAPYPKNTAYNAGQRYYYGDLVIAFNRFIANPVIHIAGLGGAYRYLIPGGNQSNPNDWRSTYFSTEIDVVGFPVTKLSGNGFFQVTGNQIKNSATYPSGGSTSDPGTIAYPFDDFGAASGSIRITGTTRFVTLRVYLRGAPSKAGGDPAGADFAWSAYRKVSATYNREPVTGDLWWVSVSTEPSQLIPLPVTGMRLNAALNSSNNVELNWKTYAEIDSKEFEIQRSTDGTNFTTIGTKAAAGNSATELNYNFVDPNMQASVYYYRLKQNDINNDFAYSNIVPVRKASGSIKSVRAFPNPAVAQLNLEFSNAKGNYVISLINQGGQEVATQKAVVTYDVQYISVNRNSLPTGSYIVRVKNTESGEVFNQNVILQ